VTNPSWALKKWQAVRPRLIHDLYELTARLGGRVSGEHGVGHKRKKYLPMFLSREHIELLRRLKRALDPNNILNPGKIVDV
jgi:glycolate oxidase